MELRPFPKVVFKKRKTNYIKQNEAWGKLKKYIKRKKNVGRYYICKKAIKSNKI